MEEGLRVAYEKNFPALVSINEFLRARALVQIGELDLGMDQIVGYTREMTRFAPTPVGAALIYPTPAEAYLAAGRTNEGIQAVARGIAILEENQARFAEPELYRLSGELMLVAANATGEPKTRFVRQSKSREAKAPDGMNCAPRMHSPACL